MVGPGTALDALQLRVDGLLALRRRRRLRVQLPLGALAASCMSVGLAIIVQPPAFGLATPGLGALLLHLGAFFLLICIMATNRVLIIVSAVSTGLVALTAYKELVLTIMPAAALLHGVAHEHAPLRYAGVVISFVSLVVGLAVRLIAVSGMLVSTSVGYWQTQQASWLLRHLTSQFGWLSVGVVVRSVGQLFGLGLQGTLGAGAAVYHAVFAAEASACACALFCQGAKAALHRCFHLRGSDGVTSAAGIAEILDGVKAAEVLANAALSFRAVRMDRLRFEHMLRAAGQSAPLGDQPERSVRGAMQQRIKSAFVSAQSGVRRVSCSRGLRSSLTSTPSETQYSPRGGAPARPNDATAAAGALDDEPGGDAADAVSVLTEHTRVPFRRPTASERGKLKLSRERVYPALPRWSTPGASGDFAAALRHVSARRATPCASGEHAAALAAAEAAEARVCQPAKLREVDAFISHSWHDDPVAKWEALQIWRAAFVAANGREPLVWFDSLCIDQNDIASQLPRVPIYLAGCNMLLVLYGETYLSRLWCIAELFVFYQAHLPDPPDHKIHFIALRTPPVAHATTLAEPSPALAGLEGRALDLALAVPPRPSRKPRAISQLWAPDTDLTAAAAEPADADACKLAAASLAAVHCFDVRGATTAVPADKARLLAMIEGSGDSIEAFNGWTRAIIGKKLNEAHDAAATRARLAHQLEREVREHARQGRPGRQLSVSNVPLSALFSRRRAEPEGDEGSVGGASFSAAAPPRRRWATAAHVDISTAVGFGAPDGPPLDPADVRAGCALESLGEACAGDDDRTTSKRRGAADEPTAASASAMLTVSSASGTRGGPSEPAADGRRISTLDVTDV